MKTNTVSLILISLLTGFAFLQRAQAVVPPPDGGYPGFNTAEGQNALLNLDVNGGLANTAVGWFALSNNIDTDFNTAVGAGSLLFNQESSNTAVGAATLLSNDQGYENTAVGVAALLNNTTGFHNTAIGDHALNSNSTGSANTAIGRNALSSTTGSSNIALGQSAGLNVSTASDVICLGSLGQNVSHTCFIGNVRGATTEQNNAVPVLIDSAGQLGTISSSRQFKKEIQPMDTASEAILALKPVTFHYKSDKTNRPEFGLIAEEVAEVNPHLVVRDENGEIYTVRYDAVNAMLLNEFLKEHRKVQELEANDAEQQKEIKALVATVKEQAAQIQKVSAQLELNKPVPQVAENN
jgi:hypothetical protein